MRKQPNFAVDTAMLDFGDLDSAQVLKGVAIVKEFVLTNTSKSEKTFAIEVLPTSPGESQSLAEISLTRDEADAGTALSKEQEEEAEGLLQKLKIARRKGKADKIQKYEARLTELGVSFPSAATAASESDAESTGDGDQGVIAADGAEQGKDLERTDSDPPVEAEPPKQSPQKASVSTLIVTLSASQKTKISVQLIMRDVGGTMIEGKLEAKIKVYEKKNTDETIFVAVTAATGCPTVPIMQEQPVIAQEEDAGLTSGESECPAWTCSKLKSADLSRSPASRTHASLPRTHAALPYLAHRLLRRIDAFPSFHLTTLRCASASLPAILSRIEITRPHPSRWLFPPDTWEHPCGSQRSYQSPEYIRRAPTKDFSFTTYRRSTSRSGLLCHNGTLFDPD